MKLFELIEIIMFIYSYYVKYITMLNSSLWLAVHFI